MLALVWETRTWKVRYCLHWGYSKMCYRFGKYSKERVSKSFGEKLESTCGLSRGPLPQRPPSTEASTSATLPFDLEQVLTLGFSSGKWKTHPAYVTGLLWDSKWITSGNMLYKACRYAIGPARKWKSLVLRGQDSGNLSITSGQRLGRSYNFLGQIHVFVCIMPASSS